MNSSAASPQPERQQRPLDMAGLMQLQWSFAPSRILSAALQLDVFSPLASGAKSADELVSATGYSKRGLPMLLDALVAFGLLHKSADHYALAQIAEQYLVKGKPDYVGAVLIPTDPRLMDAWNQLAESVRTGEPYGAVEEQKLAEEFFPAPVRWLHVLNSQPARRLAEALKGKTGRDCSVLDVACGTGIWSITFAQVDPGAQATANDFPGVLDNVTRKYVERDGLSARFRFAPGDIKQIELSPASFDLALFGNVIHSEGEAGSRTLFAKVFRALKPGGQLAVIDMIPNDERTGPPFPLIFALNMLVNTRQGSTYTVAEYRRWLAAAGFAAVETIDIGSYSPAVIARKG